MNCKLSVHVALVAAWAAGLALNPFPATAADITTAPIVKAPAYTRVPCTISSCTGWFIGGSLGNTGGNFNVIGTGLNGIAQNGLSLGVLGGYEFWNGQWYAALLADADYDASLNANVGGIPETFKQRWTYGGKVRLGYSLASAFGLATTGQSAPTLPQQFLNSLMTPYVTVGESYRHGQPALVSGVGVEALLATNYTLDVEYLNYAYNQGGTSGTVAGIPTSQTTENAIRMTIARHF